MRFLPTEAEVKLLRQYERDRKPLEALSDEDRFMMQFSRIERLSQRMSIMTFILFVSFCICHFYLSPSPSSLGQQTGWQALSVKTS